MTRNGSSHRRDVRSPRVGAAETPPNAYADFVLHARRSSPAMVEVHVSASPVGALAVPQPRPYPAQEARRLRESFHSSRQIDASTVGRMAITQAEASAIGRRLAEVVFPPAVSRLLCASLAHVVRSPQGGLRLRLVLDASLLDLPWEYLLRPDQPTLDGVSGFLLLDPRISLVRQAENPTIKLAPITRKQHLVFNGTLWEGGEDRWDVRGEYERLATALRPVARWIEPTFCTSTALDLGARKASTAIFHYAGHCSFDEHARAYLIRENPLQGPARDTDAIYLEDIAPQLRASGTRLVVLSACDSGFAPAVTPLLDAGIPAVVAVNGAVHSASTIEFCSKLYDSLAVGFSLDEAVARARLHTLEWGQRQTPPKFDWGLFMVYMPSSEPVLLGRAPTRSVAQHQHRVAAEHELTVNVALNLARELDGMNFGEIMSELSRRRVLILGRFSKRRLAVLEALKRRLAELPQQYQPELFTFDKPRSRDLVESIIGFAALSRFIIADLSEPRSVPQELEAIVPRFLSVPVAPLIHRGGRPYATFSSIERHQNVLKLQRYDDVGHLERLVERELVPKAEAMLSALRESAR